MSEPRWQHNAESANTQMFQPPSELDPVLLKGVSNLNVGRSSPYQPPAMHYNKQGASSMSPVVFNTSQTSTFHQSTNPLAPQQANLPGSSNSDPLKAELTTNGYNSAVSNASMRNSSFEDKHNTKLGNIGSSHFTSSAPSGSQQQRQQATKSGHPSLFSQFNASPVGSLSTSSVTDGSSSAQSTGPPMFMSSEPEQQPSSSQFPSFLQNQANQPQPPVLHSAGAPSTQHHNANYLQSQIQQQPQGFVNQHAAPGVFPPPRSGTYTSTSGANPPFSSAGFPASSYQPVSSATLTPAQSSGGDFQQPTTAYQQPSRAYQPQSFPPSAAGFPVVSGGASTSAGVFPPSSTGSFPPSSTGAFPPSSTGSFPPSSTGAFPPPSTGAFPPSSVGTFPPSSTGTGTFPPPLSSGAFPQAPLQGAGGFPPAPPNSGSFPPPPSSGTFQPPPSPGVFQPPASSGGFQPASATTLGAYPPSQTPGQPPLPPPGSYLPPGAPPPPPTAAGTPGMPTQPPPSVMQQPPPPQQQPIRRLDPDQMPSLIQVIQDDQKSRGGVTFTTGERGALPPLVTTDFVTQDQGNCNPRFARATMYNIPCTSDLAKQCFIPIGLTITPFARLHSNEYMPPVVDCGEPGPIRCNRCKAYMCPYMTFVDGGRRFQCNFCTCVTDVPEHYFAHLDHTGRRTDAAYRPELSLGSYEFIATKDYCRNNALPKAPAYIFMIDVSYNSQRSGLLPLLCARLKAEVLANLPRENPDTEISVGFVTYDRDLHFYSVKNTLAQPQMYVVSDLNDVFLPLLDGFLVKLSECEVLIDSLFEQLPSMFAQTRETETMLGPVIQAGLDALKSAGRPGKLLIFHTSLPIAEAPGKLKNREDRKLLGTDKEKQLLGKQTDFYTTLGNACVQNACGVDLFLFPNAYIDVATVGEICRVTGGQLHKYTYFQAEIDGDQLMEDLRINVMKPTAFDVIMRIRTSTGIRPTDFLGNFYMENTTDLELAVLDSTASVAVEIKHDDKLTEGEGALVQIVALYTSIGGQRRLRIHNLSLNCTSQMSDIFRSVELDCLINLFAKKALRDSLKSPMKEVREILTNQCSHVLACYRKNCAQPSSPGQLILPECMKLLPLYVNCLIKSGAFSNALDTSLDERCYHMVLLNRMGPLESNVYFYPRLYSVHDIPDNHVGLPPLIRCSADRLKDDGAYILENGLVMFLWVGLSMDPSWLHDVFGVQSAAQIDIDKCKLLHLDNVRSQEVNAIVTTLRYDRAQHMKLIIVRQRDKLEPLFRQLMFEDKGADGSPSYVDFLCHIHKEIRSLLN